jgi:hypothetical protein
MILEDKPLLFQGGSVTIWHYYAKEVFYQLLISFFYL